MFLYPNLTFKQLQQKGINYVKLNISHRPSRKNMEIIFHSEKKRRKS